MVPQFVNYELLRSRDPQILGSCDILIDVGGIYDPKTLRFDHHQLSFQETFDDTSHILLSSAGIVYKHYAQSILSQAPLNLTSEHLNWLWRYLYRQFIMSIDALDNGIDRYPNPEPPRYTNLTTLSHRIARLNWYQDVYDSARQGERFHEASRMFVTEWHSWIEEALTIVLPSFLQFEKALPRRIAIAPGQEAVEVNANTIWEPVIDHCPDAARVVYVYWQDAKGNWCIQSPRIHPESFASRRAFPKVIRGQPTAKIKEITKIDQVNFCHRSGFFAVTKSLESCLALMAFSAENS